MNPTTSIFTDGLPGGIQIAIVPAILLVLAVVLAIRMRLRAPQGASRGATNARSPFELSPRDSKVLAGIGIAIVCALLVWDSHARHDPIPNADGADSISIVESAGDASGAPERLQIVIALFEQGTVEDPVKLREAMLPIAHGSTAQIDEFGMRFEWHQGGSNWLERSVLQSSLEDMPRGASMYSLPNMSGTTEIATLGARPLLATGIAHEAAFGVVLHAPREHLAAVFVRPLYSGDVLVPANASAVGATIGAALRRDVFRLVAPGAEQPQPRHPFARLLLETNGLGGLILVIALLFTVASLRFVPALAGFLFAGIAVLSLAARLDIGATTRGLDSADPEARCRAVARLVAQDAFAEPATRALRDHYSVEIDPEVRLAIVRAVAMVPRFNEYEAVQEIRRIAQHDADPTVRLAADPLAR
jgi:hypothetical protein